MTCYVCQPELRDKPLPFWGFFFIFSTKRGEVENGREARSVLEKARADRAVIHAPMGPHREATLVLELHRIDATRREVGKAIVDFRKRNTATLDGVVKYQADKLSARPELDRVWCDLLQADAKLLESRNAILKELSELRLPRVR